MRLWCKLQFKDVLGDAAFALLDRALLSVTNFAVGILMIRRAPEAEYASYVLAYSGILLMIGFQNALITTPMTVMALKQEPRKRQNFINALGKNQYAIWLPLGLVAVLVWALAPYLNISNATAGMILVGAVVTLFVFVHEFMRQAFFVYMLPKTVLLLDSAYAIVFLGVVYFFTTASSAPAVYTITAMGAAGLLAGILGFSLFKRHIGGEFVWDLSPLLMTWKLGRWALLGVAVTWLHNQGFLYLLSVLKGTVEVASVSASRLLFMPIPMMLASITAILRPRGSAWVARHEKDKLLLMSVVLGGCTFVAGLAYIAILLVGQQRVGQSIFGKEIPYMSSLVLLWGAVFLTQIIRTVLALVFQIFERFDTLFHIGALSAIASLSVGYWAIRIHGTPGSVVGLIVGEVMYVLCMGGCIVRNGWEGLAGNRAVRGLAK